jgi:phosphoserine phosphatase
LVVVLCCDFEQKQARSIKFCVKNSVRHLGFRTWASTESRDDDKQRFTGKLKGP